MKKSYAAVVVFAMMAILVGCKNPCKDLVCNAGHCEEGLCVCDHGYMGETCTVVLNAKFGGVYILEEECSNTGIDNYTVRLRASAADLANVNILELYRLDSTNVIPMQLSTDATRISISIAPVNDGTIETTSDGTVSADGSSLNFTYKFRGTTSGLIDICAAYLTKQ